MTVVSTGDSRGGTYFIIRDDGAMVIKGTTPRSRTYTGNGELSDGKEFYPTKIRFDHNPDARNEGAFVVTCTTEGKVKELRMTFRKGGAEAIYKEIAYHLFLKIQEENEKLQKSHEVLKNENRVLRVKIAQLRDQGTVSRPMTRLITNEKWTGSSS